MRRHLLCSVFVVLIAACLPAYADVISTVPRPTGLNPIDTTIAVVFFVLALVSFGLLFRRQKPRSLRVWVLLGAIAALLGTPVWCALRTEWDEFYQDGERSVDSQGNRTLLNPHWVKADSKIYNIEQIWKQVFKSPMEENIAYGGIFTFVCLLAVACHKLNAAPPVEPQKQ